VRHHEEGAGGDGAARHGPFGLGCGTRPGVGKGRRGPPFGRSRPCPTRRIGFFRVRKTSDQGSGHTETHRSMATFNTLMTSAGRGEAGAPHRRHLPGGCLHSTRSDPPVRTPRSVPSAPCHRSRASSVAGRPIRAHPMQHVSEVPHPARRRPERSPTDPGRR
jgi:hypothetical protein